MAASASVSTSKLTLSTYVTRSRTWNDQDVVSGSQAEAETYRGDAARFVKWNELVSSKLGTFIKVNGESNVLFERSTLEEVKVYIFLSRTRGGTKRSHQIVSTLA